MSLSRNCNGQNFAGFLYFYWTHCYFHDVKAKEVINTLMISVVLILMIVLQTVENTVNCKAGNGCILHVCGGGFCCGVWFCVPNMYGDGKLSATFAWYTINRTGLFVYVSKITKIQS